MFTFRFALASATALVLVACGGSGAASGGNNGGGNNGGGNNGGGNNPGGTPGSAFYLPFAAKSTSGGETDLYVIPSDNLSLTPIFVARTSTGSNNGFLTVAQSKQPTLNGSNVVTSLSPYAILYVAVGSDGNAHVYALSLASTSAAPSETQVSSLSLNSIGDVCGLTGSAQTNLFDPTTLFIVLHTNSGGQSSCGKGGDVYQVVHYTDSSTTAPTVVGITSSTFTALYKPGGALGGLVLLDSTTGNLDFFGSNSFTSPTVLTAGVTSWSDLVDDRFVNNTGSLGASTAFLSVTTNSGVSVWRVDSSGAPANVYTAAGLLSGVADTNNVYFLDTNISFPGGTQRIYQEAMSGGTPLELYGTVSAGLPLPPIYTLIGSNGASLVLTSMNTNTSPPSTPAPSTSVVTLPVGAPAAPTTIAGPFSGQVLAWMCPSSFGDVASDDLVLNVINGGLPGSTAPTSYSSEVLTPGGVVKQTELPNSHFLISIPSDACAVNFGSVLQVRGITDTNGGYGGGTVNAFNLSSFSATALGTTTGSGSYLVPKGDNVLVPGAGFLSDVIGSGIVGSVSIGGGSSGLAFDLSKSLIVPVTVPNSNVVAIL
jgi:hypothetical protein